MNILKRVKNSILWLLEFPLIAKPNILKEAKLRGVSEEQILFTSLVDKDEHIQRGVLADLFLDTAVYNAHTTACDILWSGTPILTIQGDRMATRTASSILTACGLSDLICKDLKTYEEKAVELANGMIEKMEKRKNNIDDDELSLLESYRKHLKNVRETCPLFDTIRWVKNLEKGYLIVWQNYLSNKFCDIEIVE